MTSKLVTFSKLETFCLVDIRGNRPQEMKKWTLRCLENRGKRTEATL